MRFYMKIKILLIWIISSILRVTVAQECLSSLYKEDTATTTTTTTASSRKNTQQECANEASSLFHHHDADHDHSSSCQHRVDKGECHSNQNYMFLHCPMDCRNDDQLGAILYYDYYSPSPSLSSTLDHHHHTDQQVEDNKNNKTSGSQGDSSSCQDLLFNCLEPAEEGKCRTNDNFRIEKCPKTCRHCFEQGISQLTIGVRQTIPEESKHDAKQILQMLETIQSTAKYMAETVMTEDRYSSVRYECYNYHEHCAAYASQGECINTNSEPQHDESDLQLEMYEFMMMNCAPACQVCENMILIDDEEMIKDCTPDYTMDIFGENEMNEMFQRIIGEIPLKEGTVVPDYTVQVLSRPLKPQDDKPDVDAASLDYHVGPWIILLDDFVTEEECDRLIELGSIEGYEWSELEEEKGKDEEEIRKERESEDDYRTSTNSWCEGECYRDPIAKRVMQKIENVTGVPESHSEHLQLLRYVPGQYYKEHHDYIDGQQHQNPGPRILTFYLYLNDVEEGGGTRFTDIYGDDTAVPMDVQPKRGRALVWPSVFVENPHERDDRTYHEALTVTKGSKYGANAWLHLRPFKNDPCDYDRFYELTGEYDSEDDEEEEDVFEDDDDEEEEEDEDAAYDDDE